MASRIIGRLGIKLIPETSRFRQEAATRLKAIEKQLPDMKVDLRLNLSAKEKSEASAEIEAWEEKQNPDLKVNIDLNKKDMALVAGQLAALTKQRTVDIAPRIDAGSMAAAGSALAGFSGLRVTTGLMRKFREELLNLDQAVPVIGVVQHAVAGLGAYVLGVSGNLFSLSNSLASMGQAGLALPGILGGLAVGLGISAAALVDFNEQVPQTKGYLEDLQDTISGNFWDEAAKPIRSLVDELFPLLNKVLVETSASLGSFFGSFATSLKTTMLERLPYMFDRLTESVDIAAKFTDFYAGILTILGQTGAAYLPRLAEGFGQASAKFYDFLHTAAADGSLTKWIDEGIVAIGNFGSVLGSLGSIFASLGKASEAAGGATLATLAESLRGVAEAASSPGFQKGLTETLAAAYGMMDKISTIAGPAVKNMVLSMSDTFKALAPTMGDTIGTAIGSIADALANPAVAAGLTAMTEGFNSMVHTLAPVMDTVASKFEPLGILIGALAENIGTVLAAAIETLVPVFTSVATSLTPVIEKLGPLLGGVIKDLAPVFETLGKNISEKVAPALGKMVDAVQGLWDVIAPILIPVLKIVITILGDALKGVLDGITLAIKGVTQVIEGLITFFKGLWDVVSGLVTGDMSKVKEGFGSMFDGLKDILLGALKTIFGAVWAYLNGTVFGFFRTFGAKVAGFFGVKFTGPISKAFETIEGIVGKVVGKIQGWWGKIVGIFTGGKAGGGITGALKGLGEKIMAPFKSAFDFLGKFLKGAWAIIVDLFKIQIELMLLPIRIGIAAIKFIFTDLFPAIGTAIKAGWQVITEFFSAGFVALKTIVVDALNGIKFFFLENLMSLQNTFSGLFDFFGILWAQVIAGLRLFGEWFVGVFRGIGEYLVLRFEAWKLLFSEAWLSITTKAKAAWDGFVKMIQDVWNFITDWLIIGIANLIKFFINGWKQIVGKSKELWTKVRDVVVQKFNELRAKIDSAVAKVKDKIRQVWEWITERTGSTFSRVRTIISDAWDRITAKVRTAIADARAKVTNGFNIMRQEISDAMSRAKSIVTDAWGRIRTAISNGVQRALDKVRSLKTSTKNALSGIGTTLINAGRELLNGFIKGIGEKWDAVKKKLTSLTDSLPDWKGPVDKDKRLLRPAGRYIIEGLIKGFDERISQVRQTLTGLTSQMARMVHTGDMGLHLGQDFGSSLVTGLRQSRVQIVREITSIANEIARALDGVMDRTFAVTANGTGQASEEILQSSLLNERLLQLERQVTAASRRRAQAANEAASETITIGNISIPLEDLKQLKDLEQFLEMLRVRARQG